jgi:hypothetical protein
MRPDLTPPLPGAAARAASDLDRTIEGVDAGVLNTVADAVEDGAPLTDELLAGLPPEVAEILSALPFIPGPAGDLLPAQPPDGVVPDLTPAPEQPAQEPQPAPAPAPKAAPPAPKIRVAAGDRDTVFGGLPATGHAGTTTGSVIHVGAVNAGATQLALVDEA